MNKTPYSLYKESLGTIREGILLTRMESPTTPTKNVVKHQRQDSYGKFENGSGQNVSMNMNRSRPMGDYLSNAIAMKQKLRNEINKLELAKSKYRYSGANAHSRLVRVSGKQSSSSDDSTLSDSEDEILTPFEATRNIKIQPPSYWFGCSYIQRSNEQSLDITIRQTGILPAIKYSRVTLNVYLRTNKTVKQTVTLLKSSKDKSFRSSSITFNNITDYQIKTAHLTLRVIAHKFFSKRQVAEMVIDLSNCSSVTEKSEWSRIQTD
jgi:hypothetical protein